MIRILEQFVDICAVFNNRNANYEENAIKFWKGKEKVQTEYVIKRALNGLRLY